MQVNFPEGSCGSVIGNKKLELLQFHFHTPSEHALNSKRYAMEAHLVHREIGTDNLTVLGVMIQRAKGAPSNPALRKALDLAPEQGGKVRAPAHHRTGPKYRIFLSDSLGLLGINFRVAATKPMFSDVQYIKPVW